MNSADTPPEIVAVLLAAGRGTRMGKLTDTIPKPLVPVLGRPAIYWVIDGLISAGIKRCVVVTGYLAEKVRDALINYRSAEIAVTFVNQDEQNGTAHAMKLTREAVGGAPVLLAFADIMTSPDNFSAMVQPFYDRTCDLTAAIRDAGDPWRAAAVYTDQQGIVTDIVEKPAKGTSATPWSHAGMYCFANMIYDYIERVQPSVRGEYEITDAVRLMIRDGLRCRAVELTGYWKDLATPEDIELAENMMAPTAA